MSFITAFVWAYFIWLVLTAGSKGMLWSMQELVAGLIFSAIVAYATR
ncbi:cation:proton antiporter, partial [Thermococci archaeon]